MCFQNCYQFLKLEWSTGVWQPGSGFKKASLLFPSHKGGKFTSPSITPKFYKIYPEAKKERDLKILGPQLTASLKISKSVGDILPFITYVILC